MSSASAPKTILLKGDPLPAEGIATAAIRPGMLLQMSAPPRTDLPRKMGVRAHATAGANTPMLIARELDFAGGSIDDEYELDDNVLMYHARSGDEFYALLQAGSTVTAGTTGLESGGDGSFRTLASGTLLAKALETVNNSAGSGPVRIKVQAL